MMFSPLFSVPLLLLLHPTESFLSSSLLPAVTKRNLSHKQTTLLHSSSATNVADSSSDGDDSILSKTKKHDIVSIEYCTGCRWMLRSAWMAQELLTTFQNELDSVTLIPCRPPKPGGTFLVTYNNEEIVWDRKVDGGFPESKQLKQKIRDLIAPNQFLGHSDTLSRQEGREEDDDGKDEETQLPSTTASVTVEKCEDCPDDPIPAVTAMTTNEESSTPALSYDSYPLPNVEITYCTGCRWLFRAAWMAQELLTTFDTELNSVTLSPSRPPTSQGGTFIVQLDDTIVLWDRKEMGRFPEMKELKQIVRDKIAPQHDLGHSDKEEKRKEENPPKEEFVEFEEMDDDEAEDMRSFFGVL